MANAMGRTHLKKTVGDKSRIVLYHPGGGFDPAGNKVHSASGQTDPMAAKAMEWTGKVISDKSTKTHLVIELTCTVGDVFKDGAPAIGTLSITLMGGTPAPPKVDDTPVIYINDGT